MLIGPKESGKTFIESLVDTRATITFLRVESIWPKRYVGSIRTTNETLGISQGVTVNRNHLSMHNTLTNQ